MKVITLVNEKGGVGKTTLSVHLAAGLAIRGERVLLIDADAQGHSTIHLNHQKRGGLFNLLIDGAEWSDETERVDPGTFAGDMACKGTLYIMPSNIKTQLIPMATSEMDLLHERLDDIRLTVDTVIIDTPPTPSLLHSMIYVCSNHILIPSQPEAFAADGLMESLSRVPKINKQRLNMGLDKISILGVQMVMVETGTNAHQYALKQAKKTLGDYLWTPIPKRTRFREAQMVRKTLFAYAPQDEATADVWAMVDRVQAGVS